MPTSEAPVSGKSKRFQSSRPARWLVPAVFIILILALVVMLLVVALSLVGLTPGA